jgi:predicted DNA-binding transcriptional regulator YafY
MNNPTTNAIRLLLKLLSSPNRMTRRDLVEYLGVSKPDIVTGYINNIQAAGITIEADEHHRYNVIPRRGFKELSYLAPLSEADKSRLKSLLGQLPTAEATQLYNKLESLYDFQQLGLNVLRAPEIEKIRDLEVAIRDRQRVVLVNYRSRTGNDVRNRTVEAFGIEPEHGLVRAYDTQAGKLRTSHFMISRFDRVRVLDEPWAYEQDHYLRPADAFNIVMDRTTMVHFTLDVGAYNDLIERHPKARQFTRPGKREDTWDFQGKVNAQFIGLIPFLIANWRGVAVHGPAPLFERLQEEILALSKKFSE